jgi:hypothetical protein
LVTNFATLISLTVALSGLLALGTQSAKAKATHISTRKDKNYFVPPPPPYTPSIATARLSMSYALSAKAEAVVDHKPDLTAPPVYDAKTLEQIDGFDTEISNSEKEIGKLLNL